MQDAAAADPTAAFDRHVRQEVCVRLLGAVVDGAHSCSFMLLRLKVSNAATALKHILVDAGCWPEAAAADDAKDAKAGADKS
jgi:hypothetical protein